MKHKFFLLVLFFSIFVGHIALADTAFALSQNNIKLKTGDSTVISIYGNGGYYVAANSNPDVAAAYISGQTLVVSASSFGGTNITVCVDGSHCTAVYVYVDMAGVNATVLPTLSNFTVSSQGAFMKPGSMVTISFNTNVPVVNPYILINNQKLTATGSGSGSYSASYTLTGSEPSLVPVRIHFLDTTGNGADVVASFGMSAVVAPQSIVTPVIATPAPVTVATPTLTNTFVFKIPLALGSKGSDVIELQKRLTADGVYSGPENGSFGLLTKAAVKKYQVKHGLTPLGSVGPGTRSLLNK